jgi:hypothetical protein
MQGVGSAFKRAEAGRAGAGRAVGWNAGVRGRLNCASANANMIAHSGDHATRLAGA